MFYQVAASNSNRARAERAELFRHAIDSRFLDFRLVERYPVDLHNLSIDSELDVLAFVLEIVREPPREPIPLLFVINPLCSQLPITKLLSSIFNQCRVTTAALIIGTLSRERQTQTPSRTKDAGLSRTKNLLGGEKVASTTVVPALA